jgi:hypothetical protein
MATLAIGNIDWKNGKINPSGIVPIAYRIAKADITSWPTIEDDPEVAATVGALVNYTGDFVLALGKVWDKIYSTQGKGKATFEPVGETDMVSYVNKGTLSFPDLTDEVRAYAKVAANGDYVYIIHTPNGRYHVIGNEDLRVKSSFSGDTGDATGSAKGVTISLEVPDNTPLPLYSGVLVTSEGSLDISTKVFTPKV